MVDGCTPNRSASSSSAKPTNRRALRRFLVRTRVRPILLTNPIAPIFTENPILREGLRPGSTKTAQRGRHVGKSATGPFSSPSRFIDFFFQIVASWRAITCVNGIPKISVFSAHLTVRAFSLKKRRQSPVKAKQSGRWSHRATSTKVT